MIIDANAHVTAEEYGSIHCIERDMKAYGIGKTVLFPGGMIDVRKMSKYVSQEERGRPAYIPNDLVESCFKAAPERFAGFYCIDPPSAADPVGELGRAHERGFSGLKLAPIVHRFALNCPAVKALCEAAGALGLPVYTHVVYGPEASTRVFGELAAEFPHTVFILGHMGLGPADMEAVELARRRDNVFLETSGGSFMIIRSAYEALGATKLIYGPEFPMQNAHVELEKVRLIASERDFEQIAGRTIAGLLQ
jgi:predicted TIM-barrel fold metal-dependent hydrolase